MPHNAENAIQTIQDEINNERTTRQEFDDSVKMLSQSINYVCLTERKRRREFLTKMKEANIVDNQVKELALQ